MQFIVFLFAFIIGVSVYCHNPTKNNLNNFCWVVFLLVIDSTPIQRDGFKLRGRRRADFFELKDSLHFFRNGRQPTFFGKRKTTYNFCKMEDNLNISCKNTKKLESIPLKVFNI
jgi:hypothetical protein